MMEMMAMATGSDLNPFRDQISFYPNKEADKTICGMILDCFVWHYHRTNGIFVPDALRLCKPKLNIHRVHCVYQTSICSVVVVVLVNNVVTLLLTNLLSKQHQ